MSVDVSRVEADWKARGFSFGVFVDPPGRRWDDFTHPVDELFMLVEGDVEVEIGGNAFPAEPGKELMIPARTLHSVRTRGPSGSRWIYGYQDR